jgi:hypothetical protein
LKNRRTFLVIFLVILLLLPLSTLGYQMLKKNNPTKVNTQKEGNILKADLFSLEYEYQGENEWIYILRGELPTPCYGVEVTPLVRESYPEQVTVEVKISSPDPEVICIQMIKDYEENGEFKASENAKIDLQMSYKE